MDLWSIQISIPLALAVVATLGYLFGRRNRTTDNGAVLRSRRELRRAQWVANELEKIASSVRKSLARHHTSVSKFKDRVAKLGEQQQETAWKELCHEVENMLKPTLHLANDIASAYDKIRQQSANLMSFTEVRTDSLTGVNNRRGLDDALTAQFALVSRYRSQFSLAIFNIDNFKKINEREGHLRGDQILQELAKLFDESVRETDVVARYGGEEFVVIMPETELEAGCLFGERLRAKVEQRMSLTISGGVAAAIDGDTQDSLLARANGAMYSAKTAGRNCVFFHDGEQTEAVVLEECSAAQA